MLEQLDNQASAELRELFVRAGLDLGHGPMELRRRLRDHYAALGQHAAHLVDDGRSLVDQQLAQPMQCLDILLLDGLDRHEAHRWPARSFNNRLGVVAIVLVGLHERRNVLRADESYVDAVPPQSASPVMGRAAGFHHDELRTQSSDRFEQRRAADLGAMDDNAGPRRAVQLEYTFGQIDSENVDFHDGPPCRSLKNEQVVSPEGGVGSISVDWCALLPKPMARQLLRESLLRRRACFSCRLVRVLTSSRDYEVRAPKTTVICLARRASGGVQAHRYRRDRPVS